MEEILRRYRTYLCGEHNKTSTIENKHIAAKILLRQTKGLITKDTMQHFKAWSNTHYSHNSRNNRINAWNEFLRWNGHPEHQMKHIGFIETNQHALSEKEMDTLLRTSTTQPLDHLIILCLFDGALRPSEIINIKTSQRDNNHLYLDDTKTGDKRIIMSPALIHAWSRYLQIRPTPAVGHEDILILKDHCKQQGTRYRDIHTINDRVRDIGRQAGLQQPIQPYTIRRTSATLRQCKYSKYYMGDDKLVQMLFRHKDLATTKRYDRTTDLDIERYFNDLYRQSTINTETPTVNHQESTENKIYPTENNTTCSLQDFIINEEDEGNQTFSFSFSFLIDLSQSHRMQTKGDGACDRFTHFTSTPYSPSALTYQAQGGQTDDSHEHHIFLISCDPSHYHLSHNPDIRLFLQDIGVSSIQPASLFHLYSQPVFIGLESGTSCLPISSVTGGTNEYEKVIM